MKSKFIALVVIAFTAFSCNTTKLSQENMPEVKGNAILTETSWELSKLEGKTVQQSNGDTGKVYFILNSADNTITGYTGCNFFRGTYTATDNGIISFSALISTQKACLDSSIEESSLFQVFDLADNFTLSGETLTLNKAKKAPLAMFTKSKVNENTITEKYWKLITLEGKNVIMAENQEREIYFTLKTQDNRIQGFSGCNSFSGNFTLVKGNRIRFEQIGVTMKMCPDVKVNESEILNVFNSTDNYTITGDTLTLNVGKRAPLATFEAVYF